MVYPNRTHSISEGSGTSLHVHSLIARYFLDHLPPVGESGRTQLRLYRGGHMFYIDAQSRKAFSADAREFYQTAQ